MVGQKEVSSRVSELVNERRLVLARAAESRFKKEVDGETDLSVFVEERDADMIQLERPDRNERLGIIEGRDGFEVRLNQLLCRENVWEVVGSFCFCMAVFRDLDDSSRLLKEVECNEADLVNDSYFQHLLGALKSWRCVGLDEIVYTD